MSCSGAWLAVTVRVADPPGDTVVPPEIVTAGTLLLVIVVWAELGDPTVYPEPEAIESTMVGSCSTVLLLRVWTSTVVCTAPAGRVAVTGGVTMSLLPAVPLEVRFTVSALVGAVEAVITKAAGWP